MHTEKLKQVYNAKDVVQAGDFNVVLHADQCHSGIINKPRTSRELAEMIEGHGMRDVGEDRQNVEPTFRRHGHSIFSLSRDMILHNHRITTFFSCYRSLLYFTNWTPESRRLSDYSH